MADTDDGGTGTAGTRTRWAEDRTVLAHERTFSGWMRTGLGSVGVAIGLRAVFGAAQPTWVPKTVATVFLVAAIVIFWSARNQARIALGRLDSHDAEAQPRRSFTALATILTLGTVATGAVLWSL